MKIRNFEQCKERPTNQTVLVGNESYGILSDPTNTEKECIGFISVPRTVYDKFKSTGVKPEQSYIWVICMDFHKGEESGLLIGWLGDDKHARVIRSEQCNEWVLTH
jgi:hypothetical protein